MQVLLIALIIQLDRQKNMLVNICKYIYIYVCVLILMICQVCVCMYEIHVKHMYVYIYVCIMTSSCVHGPPIPQFYTLTWDLIVKYFLSSHNITKGYISRGSKVPPC